MPVVAAKQGISHHFSSFSSKFHIPSHPSIRWTKNHRVELSVIHPSTNYVRRRNIYIEQHSMTFLHFIMVLLSYLNNPK